MNTIISEKNDGNRKSVAESADLLKNYISGDFDKSAFKKKQKILPVDI